MYKLFTDKEQLKEISLLRVIYFIIFLAAFGLTEIGRYIYRPYIYENNIYDFGLADSMGNLGGIVVQIFLGLTILNPTLKKGIRLIAFFTLGYIAYEILQPYLPKGTFDWRDLAGTAIGGLFAFVIFLGIHKLPIKYGNTIQK